jgi:asparagine synthase (glutamine-hydrolysing)
MPFIHGEIDWTGPPAAAEAGVGSMLSAVTGHPWSTTVMKDVSTSHVRCVLACQVDASVETQAIRVEDETSAEATSPLVADLRLHERDTLRTRLSLTRAEALQRDDLALVHDAYVKWGSRLADQLLAEGTLAIWDRHKHRLLCWRDPAGVRPFYYHHDRGRSFVFSSDLTAIAANPKVSGLADLPYLRSLLEAGGRFSHPSRTLLQDIRKLPAAHFLLVDESGLQVHRYWRPIGLAERRYRHDGDYIDELREILQQAVACRVLGHENHVGAHLSGGLDSSSLAILAARDVAARGRRLTGFSWAPPRDRIAELEGDERLLAEAAAQQGDVDLRYTTLLPKHVTDLERTDRALRPTESMRYESATSRLAVKLGVHTMISGWGGDEGIVWNGTGYFADLARRGHWLTVQRELRRRAAIHNGGSLLGAWKHRVVTPLLFDSAFSAVGWLKRHSAQDLPPELRPEMVRLLLAEEPLVTPPGKRECPGVRRMQLQRLTGGALQYRMEAWASHGAVLGLTYVFPLLDRRLIEFALSIPDYLYFRHGWKRWLYRTAMEGILPEAVRWNPDKYDDAANAQSRLAVAEAADTYRNLLRNRRDNPFINVERLLSPDADESRLKGTAAWMAFTGLRLP